uniref:EF-hand domain-containing protein n=1 Tax=Macrostomum lignano TaxID=282301 RepID=A0A1I8FK80_9PLAT
RFSVKKLKLVGADMVACPVKLQQIGCSSHLEDVEAALLFGQLQRHHLDRAPHRAATSAQVRQLEDVHPELRLRTRDQLMLGHALRCSRLGSCGIASFGRAQHPGHHRQSVARPPSSKASHLAAARFEGHCGVQDARFRHLRKREPPAASKKQPMVRPCDSRLDTSSWGAELRQQVASVDHATPCVAGPPDLGWSASLQFSQSFRKATPQLAMSQDRKQQLTKLFEQIDKDKSGYLSLSELKEGCAKIGITESEAQAVLSKMDVNQDGNVSVSGGRCLRRRICRNRRRRRRLASGVRMAVTALCDTSSAPPWLFLLLEEVGDLRLFLCSPVGRGGGRGGSMAGAGRRRALRHHQGVGPPPSPPPRCWSAAVQLLAEVVNLGAALGEGLRLVNCWWQRTGRLSRTTSRWCIVQIDQAAHDVALVARLPNRSDSTCHFLACRAAGGGEAKRLLLLLLLQ